MKSVVCVTDLQSAAEDADHEHDDSQVVREHIPPRLQHSERRLLFRELPELHHRNHDAFHKREENYPTWHSVDTMGKFHRKVKQ